jgi:hypothetical protein
MHFFHDAEFLEDGKTIDLVSYAIVADNGDELYLVNAEADWHRVQGHPWLLENVMPFLPGEYLPCDHQDRPATCWYPDLSDPRVAPRSVIAEKVRQFISSYGEDRDDHELWAWYGAYDHVALAQLFGRMLDLPACVPMHTNDLKTLVGKRRVPDILRTHVGGEHDALADARWDRLVYQWARQQEKRELYGWRQRVATRESEIAAYWLALPDGVREQVRQATRGYGFSRALDSAAGTPQP